MRSNKKDEVCHSFVVQIFTKSLHRGGVQCHCNACHDGMSCWDNGECGHGVCKVDPNTKCGKLQAAGFKIACQG